MKNKIVLIMVICIFQLFYLNSQNKISSAKNLMGEGDYAEAEELLKSVENTEEVNQLLIECFLNLIIKDDISYTNRIEYFSELQTYVKNLSVNNKQEEILKPLFMNKSVALQNLGSEFIKSSKFKSALSVLEISYYLDQLNEKSDTLLLYNMVQLSGNLKEQEKTIEYINLFHDAGGKRKKTYIMLVDLYKEENKDNELITTLHKAHELFPSEKIFVTEEINLYMEQEDYKKALDRLSELSKEKYYDEELMVLKGSLYENEGDIDNAEKTYSDILQKNNKNVVVLLRLGTLNLDYAILYKDIKSLSTDYFNKAKGYLKNAQEIEPENLEVLTALSQLYSLTGEFDKYNIVKKKIDQLQ